MANDLVNQRVVKELIDIQRGSDLSLAVAFEDSDVRRVKALIIGPPGTPYEFGFFEFTVAFPPEYPSKAPILQAVTTNGGFTRFNPNIYADGKVCLSILGTWTGEPGEEWSAAQCLESVLISIQSLMSSNPYENEPGYEKTNVNDKEAIAYAAKVHHESLRISVITRLECYLNIYGPLSSEPDPEETFGEDDGVKDDVSSTPFVDLCKRRFLWYYPTYIEGIENALAKHGKHVEDEVKFPKAAFEMDRNEMSGAYQYTALKARLEKIRRLLDVETEDWTLQGQRALRRENPVALTMQNTFKALEKKLQKGDTHVELVDDNPFVWRLIIFGAPMTNLDGGIFKIKMVFNTSFPEIQPRVTVETPLFHHRISTNGVLCYIPKKPTEIASHIEGIVEAIQEESPRYDPRAVVNPEVARMYWGNAEQRKLYNRKLRRSAQESSEYE